MINRTLFLLNTGLNQTVYKMGLIFSSRLLTAVLGIIFLPLYIKYLGVESYGLVAFYSILAGALTLLGTGLGASTNREITILLAQGSGSQRLASLLFSVEILNWLIAIIAGVAIVILSPFIANHWVNAQHISTQAIIYSIMIMGFLFACQLPYSVYEGAINGMHMQGSFALISTVFSAIKAVGIIFVLEFISADIITFFLWQLIMTLALTMTARYMAYKMINPLGKKKFFSLKLLRRLKKYALGITGISIVTFFVTQVDKVIVSKFLLLEYVGYYNLAFLLAGVLGMIASPIQTIALPKFNSLAAQSNTVELRTMYYKTSKWMALLVMPIGFTMIAFSGDIIYLWTGNQFLTSQTAPILRVVALGYIFNGVASIFYLYTLAKGNTRYGFYQNLCSIVVTVPLIFILTKQYGALGAASCWLIYNTMLLIVSLPVFHHLYLKGQVLYWFKNCFVLPALVSLCLFLGVKWLQFTYYPAINIVELITLVLVLFIVYGLIMKDIRGYIFDYMRKGVYKNA